MDKVLTHEFTINLYKGLHFFGFKHQASGAIQPTKKF
jgi:hypothetical protein